MYGIEFFITELLNIHHFVLRFVDSVNQFIELQIDGVRVAILGVLNDKDHQERNDRGSGVDHQLPRVGVVKHGTSCCPDNDNDYRPDESPFGAEPARRARRKLTEGVALGLLAAAIGHYLSCFKTACAPYVRCIRHTILLTVFASALPARLRVDLLRRASKRLIRVFLFRQSFIEQCSYFLLP